MASAVLQRSRRSTAGQRLASLIGQAAEDDDAFWSHAIWSEGRGGFSRGDDKSEDSGDDNSSGDDSSDEEASYRASDEEIDTFDSDFNESESSSDEEDAEAELLREEKREKRAAPSQQLIGKRGRVVKPKRVMGEGWNAGLVLNWFPAADGTSAAVSSTQLNPSANISSVPSATASSAAAMPSVQTSKIQPTPLNQSSSTVGIPPTQHVQKLPRPQSPHRKRNLRTGTLTKTIATISQILPTTKQRITKKEKRHFTQEEMLLESLETQVENTKWIYGRKRKKEQQQQQKQPQENLKEGNITSRFVSKRGSGTVLSFMDMDSLPEILIQQSQRKAPQQKEKCVITGKEARYKDPQTKLRYYDLQSLKEIRRGMLPPINNTNKQFPDRSIVACQDEKCVKVTVTQDGIPVSPPEEKGFPTKRPPSSISANQSDKELEKVSSTPTITNPTPVKSNTNGSHTSPSRKSSRKPKPSAKLLADAAISNILRL
jgi:hypothetical protein